MSDHHARLTILARSRWRIAISLTAGMVVMYFGFILLIAFNKPLMATLIAPGLSLGILLGALVIVCSWIFTWIYVRWTNTRFDAEIEHLSGRRAE